ncbi:hypothetical protein PsorP6_003076 [Peronosclerospora sorghi]|uniref:Uncharacterized protein n=1 Tax=Peronosclerospora sorghi TaxID=230839 RepID=A0ACC0VN65_9STRA|nr:hypothetical protein PsorP6_003076 [Peronosclerospora sorghi]
MVAIKSSSSNSLAQSSRVGNSPESLAPESNGMRSSLPNALRLTAGSRTPASTQDLPKVSSVETGESVHDALESRISIASAIDM